jgi:serine/threonine protein kinase
MNDSPVILGFNGELKEVYDSLYSESEIEENQTIKRSRKMSESGSESDSEKSGKSKNKISLHQNDLIYDLGEYFFYKDKKIGKGTMGKVYLGKDKKTNNLVAIKKINNNIINKVGKNKVINECVVLSQLKHKNIVKFLNLVENDNGIFIILEYCNYKDLNSLINDYISYKETFTETEIKYYIKQILNALNYIQEKGYSHRDIKPSNILLHTEVDNPKTYINLTLKICDFGFVKKINELFNDTIICGTPLYMAPEILLNRKYTDKSDLWSVGIIMFKMMFFIFPFGNPKNIIELKKAIEYLVIDLNKIVKKTKTKWSKDCLNLLAGLLIKSPDLRFNLFEVNNHQWFKENENIGSSSESENENNSEDEDENLEQIINEVGSNIKNKAKIKQKSDIQIIENYCENLKLNNPITLKKLKVVEDNFLNFNTILTFLSNLNNK